LGRGLPNLALRHGKAEDFPGLPVRRSCHVSLQRIGFCPRFPKRNAAMDIILDPLLTVLYELLEFYKWLVIVAAIMSWLIAFGVINTYNRAVSTINDFLYRVTEPALRPIRRFMPNLGGVDISPVILIFAIWLIQMVLVKIQLANHGL
jgi:YggT family protein